MKKYILILFAITTLLNAHTIFNSNTPYLYIIGYFALVYSPIWIGVVVVVGFLLCVFDACKAFGYIVGVIFAFLVLIFVSSFIGDYIEDQQRKPYHSFAVNCDYAEYDKESLYKKSKSKIVNMVEVDGYYETNGMLHCKRFKVKLDTNTILRARCSYDYLYILQKDGKIPHYKPKSRYKDNATLQMSDFKMRYYVSYANRKKFYSYDINVCRYAKSKNCYDLDSKVLNIDNRKIKMFKKPKFASITNSRDGLYVVYKNEPSKIYLLQDSKKKIYEVVQNVVKRVINSAYVPWWGRYKVPYNTISKDDLKKIYNANPSRYASYDYTITQIANGEYEVDVTSRENEDIFIHFVIKKDGVSYVPVKLEFLKRDFYNKEIDALAKEFVDAKSDYYRLETILKLRVLQTKAQTSSNAPSNTETIFMQKFTTKLQDKKTLYDRFLKENVCLANYLQDTSVNSTVIKQEIDNFKHFIRERCQ